MADVEASLQPGLGLTTGFMQEPSADRQNQAALLRNADETLRVDELIIRSLHTDKCLGTDNCAGFKIHFRLVMQHEFVLLQCVIQRLLHGLPLNRTDIHFEMKYLVIVTSHFLGLTHRNVGIHYNGFDILAVIGADADADADCDAQLMATDKMWSRHGFDYLICDKDSVLNILDFGQQHHKLAPPPLAKDRVGETDTRLQSFCSRL